MLTFPDVHGAMQGTLACPRCGKRLSSGLACPTCGPMGAIRGNVPCFCQPDETYWGEVPQATMKDVLRTAEEKDWKAALRCMAEAGYANISNFVQDASRADWRLLLRSSRREVAVDMGCGLGTISLLLAPFYKQVIAVERVWERARFVALRAEQDHRGNVIPACADVFEAPVAPETADLIVCNGVLEWVGLREDIHRDPEQVQRTFLSRCLRLLRPGGEMYIGIENRISYRSFRGARDHTNLRFTGLMPRRLADWYVDLRARLGNRPYGCDRAVRGYRTLTHSPRRWKHLLGEIGFSDVRFYAVLPGYNRPRAFVELDHRGGFRLVFDSLFNPGASRALRLGLLAAGLTARLGLWRHFAPDLAMILRKSEA